MKLLKFSLVSVLLLSLAPLSLRAAGNNASPNWYDIEVIVFRYTDPQAGDMESWPADPGAPDWSGASALIPPAADGNRSVPATLTPLMQLGRYQLDYDWNRLKHSHDHEPLLHVAWTEPLADHGSALAVRIGVPPSTATDATAGFAIAMQPAPATPEQTPTPVYGTVKFSQYGPYLHFDVDLVCRGPLAKHIIPAPAANSLNMAPAAANLSAPATVTQPETTADFQWYRMIQDRRIEAGKLNYFDNPMFGVLVLVTPHPLTTPAP